MKKILSLIITTIMLFTSVTGFAYTKSEIIEKAQGYIEDIDIDYLTKYYWYYGGGVIMEYRFEKDGTYYICSHTNNHKKECFEKITGKYTLKDNVLTFFDESGNTNWVYVDGGIMKNIWEIDNYGKKLFYIPSEDEYLTIINSYREVERIKVEVNGEKLNFDQQPFIENDRTLVPLRKIFEALGAEVNWDAPTLTVFAKKDDTEISLTIGSDILYKNGEKIKIDAKAKVVNDRTMVPVRAISEAFNAKVDWDQDNLTVKITK